MEQRAPTVCDSFAKKEGRGEMIKTPIKLQDLRRRIYVKAKAEPSWRFWGLYVHVCKVETLRQAYAMAKKNKGAPGIDGVTFEAIEAAGLSSFLNQIREELKTQTYLPMQVRKVGIPKSDGKQRILSIPTIRDRVVQGALKLILEPIFEADFQPGSFGYRPKRSAHDAIRRVAEGIITAKTHVIDLDLRAYFDNVRHDVLLEKVAKRIEDDDVMRLVKLVLKASGKRGLPQGGVVSPLFANLYLNEVDKMLERAKEVTAFKGLKRIEYARFADDLVVLVVGNPKQRWLREAVKKRLREEISKLGVEVNEDKSHIVDLTHGGSFTFLGFQFRRIRSRNGRWMPLHIPQIKQRTALLRKLKQIFRRHRSQPIQRVIEVINPIVRGWVNYFAVGHSSKCFGYVRHWIERRIRRHLQRARKRPGFGWKQWSTRWFYEEFGLFGDYGIRGRSTRKAAPAR